MLCAASTPEGCCGETTEVRLTGRKCGAVRFVVLLRSSSRRQNASHIFARNFALKAKFQAPEGKLKFAHSHESADVETAFLKRNL